ncbi:MAG TPA: PAS domain S-box protein [Thermodesulfovibrionales bacterium]|nr:PAS domain S-box protein [Thermodesulfovibrionales bacterium]
MTDEPRRGKMDVARHSLEKLDRLASFPELNPNPIIEVDLAGVVHYINPAAMNLFHDLPAKGALHPFLADFDSLVSVFTHEGKHSHVRELKADNVWYEQVLHFARGNNVIRIYSHDITARKQAEEVLQATKEELEVRVQERTAELLRVNTELEEEIAQRKRAIGALSGQSRILEAFFDHTITPLVFLDRDFNFIRVNTAYANACQRDVSDFAGHNHFEFYPHKENEGIFKRVVATKVPYQAVARPFSFPDHPEWGVTYWDWNLVPVLDSRGEVDFLVFSLKDVTEQKEFQDRMLTHNTLLQLFSHSFTRNEYLYEVVNLMAKWSGSRCVGIRVLEKNGNIPYDAYRGFSSQFWEVENRISLHHDQCACVRVIAGTPDPQDASAMTPGGSFYCNNTIEFVKTLTPEESSRYRGTCVGSGFRSVAVVPIRYSEKVLGAIHLADEREGMVPLKIIQLIEVVTPLIGEAIYRFSIEDELWRNYEALQRSEKSLSEAQRIAGLGNWEWDLLTNELRWSDETYRIFGLTPQQTATTYVAFLNYVHPDDREFVKKSVNEAIYDRQPYNIEHRIVLPNGLLRVIHEQGEVRFDDRDEPINIVGTVQDITERKRAEEELTYSREQLRNLSMHLQSVREEERTTIAREIHDELGQVLTALKMDLSWLDKKHRGDKSLAERTKSMLSLVDSTIQTVKRISSELRPGVLDHLGLAAAIEWQAKEFEKHTGIACDVSVDPDDIVLDRHHSTTIFRIFQEALTNVARHAHATKVRISLHEKAEGIALHVEDDGRGIKKKQLNSPQSFGLIGIRERVHFLNGEIKIKGIRNKGTSLTIHIPHGKKAAQE